MVGLEQKWASTVSSSRRPRIAGTVLGRPVLVRHQRYDKLSYHKVYSVGRDSYCSLLDFETETGIAQETDLRFRL